MVAKITAGVFRWRPNLRAVVIAVFVLLPTVAGCAQPTQSNELYNKLVEIRSERLKLWNAPQAQGGTRAPDISDIVCPIVTSELLRDAYTEVGSEYISYQFFEKSYVYTAPYEKWILRESIGILHNHYISINLTENEICDVFYGHGN